MPKNWLVAPFWIPSRFPGLCPEQAPSLIFAPFQPEQTLESWEVRAERLSWVVRERSD